MVIVHGNGVGGRTRHEKLKNLKKIFSGDSDLLRVIMRLKDGIIKMDN